MRGISMAAFNVRAPKGGIAKLANSPRSTYRPRRIRFSARSRCEQLHMAHLLRFGRNNFGMALFYGSIHVRPRIRDG